jgi:hypothetical protein
MVLYSFSEADLMLWVSLANFCDFEQKLALQHLQLGFQLVEWLMIV